MNKISKNIFFSLLLCCVFSQQLRAEEKKVDQGHAPQSPPSVQNHPEKSEVSTQTSASPKPTSVGDQRHESDVKSIAQKPAEKHEVLNQASASPKPTSVGDEKEQIIKKLEPKIESYVSKIEAISPSGDEYLIKYWPRVKNGIKPYFKKYDWNKLGIGTDIKELNIKLSLSEIEIYKNILKNLNSIDPQDEFIEEKEVLKGDLNLILGLNGSKEMFKQSYSTYTKFLKNFPESKYSLNTQYNLGFLYLKAAQYIDCVELANKQEAHWLNNKEWRDRFRSLVIEAYYSRMRYVKAEDYLWALSSRMDKEDLTQNLALRYSDSLFWQNKYLALIEWYNNEQVSKFFDDSEDWIQVSGLYLAESFFQVGQYENALNRYKKFKLSYKGKYNQAQLDFRINQCEMMLSGDYKKYIPVFYNFSLKGGIGPLKDIARVQWARLVSKESMDGEAIISEAHAIMTALLTQIEELGLIKETIYVKALLTYRLGEYKSALTTLEKIYPKRYIRSLDQPFLKSIGQFAPYLLTLLAPQMWESHESMDFLVLANRFTYAIQHLTDKSDILFWVGRCYVENGMVGSAVRIFEKLLLNMESPNKSRIALELAKAYGLMGNTEAMGRALSLIKEVPVKTDEKALYYMSKATYQMATKNFTGCTDELDSLMTKGVQGDDFFKFALEGAICARKAKAFDKAHKFISLLDIRSDNLKDANIPAELKEWHQKGLFEKINLLAETDQYNEAIAEFNKLKENSGSDASIEPPLETVFLVIDCLRKTGKTDAALEVWKEYASKTKNLPKGFGDQFSRLLELLASTELVPQAESQVVTK
ncbi:MAG: hypothetical protein ACD_73C00200G0005 [uncultured bacterium]|nr:MAG: hypothetical protein ACD_73C00200G0005 [uncultured bacterium]